MSQRTPPLAPLLVLFGTVYFVQGIVEPTACLPAQPLQTQLRASGLSTDQIGRFFGIIGLAWSLKPVLGLVSDLFPIAQRRRLPYLVVSTVLSAAAFAGAAWQSPESSSLLRLLVLAGLGIALTDVVADAVMVEVGQPLGLTGKIQAVQWGALAMAGLIVGALGGYVAEHKLQRPMLASCGLLCITSLAVTLAVLRERRHERSPVSSFVAADRQNWSSSHLETFAAAAAFLFLWNFNPFSSNVLQDYATRQLGFSEQQYGWLLTLQSVGMLAGCLLYGAICRRVPFTVLLHVSIAAGVASTLVYWLLRDWQTAVIANLLFGLTWQIGLLVQLDLAARVCPPAAAGTLFATLMAITNTANTAGLYVGGEWYDGLSAYFEGDCHRAFQALVGIGALFTAACWALWPVLKRGHPTEASADGRKL